MAVGMPEDEVFAAADAVLARGELPTVKRVRLELGRVVAVRRASAVCSTNGGCASQNG
jgi:hypothetical protein